MDKLLIAGVETTAGANLAAWLAQRFQVVGLSASGPLTISGCETAEYDPASGETSRQWIASERPQWVVYCGPGTHSTWSLPAAPLPRPDAVPVAGAWARAAREFQCEFTLVSSDAIFTGPWMFHREGGTCFCESAPSKILRLIEKEVIDVASEALVVRTNVFGWSPSSSVPGLAETVVTCAQEGQTLALDCMRHATPILATDFAEILERAYQQRLQGVYHLAGGERINPFRFACLLADQFSLSLSGLTPVETPIENRREYGTGETSLQTRRIRKALETPLPMIRDGLARLYEQHATGYRDRFGAAESLVPEKVA